MMADRNSMAIPRLVDAWTFLAVTIMFLLYFALALLAFWLEDNIHLFFGFSVK